jgi:hypothetical protein
MPAALGRIRSVRAAMQDRLVVAVTVNEIDGLIRPRREADVSHKRSSRELTFDVDVERIAVVLDVLHRAGTNVRHNLLGGNLDLVGDRIVAVTLAGHVLRIGTRERKIIRGESEAHANDSGQYNGCGSDAVRENPEHGGTRKS